MRQAVAQWLEVVDLADTTRDRYDDLIRLYVLPLLGDRQAAKLDAKVLDRLYARLQQCRDLCDGRRAAGHICRPLSSSTVRKVHYIIRGSLDRAVRWQQIGINRAELVDPRRRRRPSLRRRGADIRLPGVERPDRATGWSADRGVSAARNVALAAATGDWVLPLDADDELHAEGFGQLLAALVDCSPVVGWIGANRVLLDGGRTPHWFDAARSYEAGDLAPLWPHRSPSIRTRGRLDGRCCSLAAVGRRPA